MIVAGLSCKKDNDDDSGGSFPDSFQKVWQEEIFDDGDEIGVYFTDDKLFLWDYLGDAFDDFDDCYINEELGTLVGVDGDIYTIRTIDFFSGEEEDVAGRIIVDGDTLRVTDIEDGFETPYSDTGMAVSALTPECSFKVSEEMLSKKGIPFK
jgi:hypothetical protein